MNELEGMTFHSAEREVERLEKQLDEARQEAADMRWQLDAVPVGAIADLYTAYAYAVAGKPAAQQFPQVGRWLGILPAADTPHRTGKGDE